MESAGAAREQGESPGALLLVCSFAARHPGSFLASQLAVARASRERLGLDAVFVLPERAGRREWLHRISDGGFRCELLPAKAWRRPSDLTRIAHDAHARIVHSHYTWFDLAVLYAARRTGAAAVWHVRNSSLDYPVRQRLTDLVKGRLLARGCDAVIGVSDEVGRDLLRRGFPSDRVSVIQNGVVLERLSEPMVPPRELRAGLGIDPDAFVVLCFGWPPARKGLDVLLDAVASLHRRRAAGGLTLLVVGERQPIEAFVGDRIGELPKWLAVAPPVEDVASLFAACDVLVSSSREEGFSFAIGEAMVCGLPVVASDIPGTAHYWGAPGLLRYPVEDRAALEGQIAGLAAAVDRAALAAGNRRWALENVGADRFVDQTVECYRAILARRSAT